MRLPTHTKLFTDPHPPPSNTNHRDFDAFFRTEVELSKAKRLYQQLEARLDQERALAQDRQGSLHERILALEAQLHKEKCVRACVCCVVYICGLGYV